MFFVRKCYKLVKQVDRPAPGFFDRPLQPSGAGEPIQRLVPTWKLAFEPESGDKIARQTDVCELLGTLGTLLYSSIDETSGKCKLDHIII